IPDGSGSEFTVKFTDGDEITSKGLEVAEALKKNGKLFFRFKEECGTTVSLSYRIGADGDTLEKQIAITQSEPKTIDYILLENIGIVNSASSYTVSGGKTDIDEFYSNLGQPFYIDSLFFGSVFPATKNGIFHGRGQVIYYLGKSAKEKGDKIVCPTTVMGSAAGTSLADLRKSFFEYIEKIAVPSPYRLMYNTWYDRMMNIDADNIRNAFYNVEKQLSSHSVPPLDSYVMDDGWNNYNGDFWNINQKRFPNGLLDSAYTAKNLGSHFGLWLGPRGGYNFQKKFAKRIEKGENGYFNAESDDICVASERYLKKLEKFFVQMTRENDLNYWKLDGFMLKPCLDPKHDHITGGDHEMYLVTELWERWIKIFKSIRAIKEEQGKDMWINFTCYVSPSPWWLQYVNSIWLQNSGDIGFAKNYPKGTQAQIDSEITYRDGIYYGFLVTRGLQFPLSHIYNHEPIYGYESHLNYTDEEFEKAFFWNACRGAALNELYISAGMMNEEKWSSLSKVLNWQRTNYHILKNAMFIGGNPTENNIYCYASWSKDGEGIIALRNPTNESTALTITLNKLMGCPENLNGVKRYNVLNMSGAENNEIYKYNDKINMTLAPFEIKIFQFGTEDNRYSENLEGNDFTISFDYNVKDGIICRNDDITVSVEGGYVKVTTAKLKLISENIIGGTQHKINIVREKNKMIKIYIDNALDCAGYSKDEKNTISTDLTSDSENFNILKKATPYDDIIVLKGLLKKKIRKKRN
ncbi:MAG: alpha-galactosidase, partial [Clostridiales bacterium]|nr:alpha-galactosidase [Clostridiales bacterium]